MLNIFTFIYTIILFYCFKSVVFTSFHNVKFFLEHILQWQHLHHCREHLHLCADISAAVHRLRFDEFIRYTYRQVPLHTCHLHSSWRVDVGPRNAVDTLTGHHLRSAFRGRHLVSRIPAHSFPVRVKPLPERVCVPDSRRLGSSILSRGPIVCSQGTRG